MFSRDHDRAKTFGEHIILPALLPAVFFAVAFTPVHVIGCRNRGLLALLIASVSGLAALTALIHSRRLRRYRPVAAIWWVLSALIMTIPVVALIIMA